MIHLLPENLYRVGRTHGLSQSELQKFCQKHQSLVKKMFSLASKPGYGFLGLPDDQNNFKQLKKYLSEQKKENWENIVVLGIGGSSLGTIAVRDALISEFSKGPQLYVVDNIDPAYMAELFSNLDFKKSLFVVISKSGTTTETMAQYALIKGMLLKQFPRHYQKHLVFVTDPHAGLLQEIAREEGVTTFHIPPEIGGRFSVLTNVGLLPCGLAGLDIESLLKGAKKMRELIRRETDSNNPALLLAAAQFLLDRKKGKSMTVLMPYSNYLFRMGDWYRQLLAESIGKNPETGPTPINALGTTDQHSQLQLYHDGPNNKFFIFLHVVRHAADLKLPNVLPGEMAFLNGKTIGDIMNASYHGTSEALAHSKRPNVTIEVPRVDAEHLGALFMLFECQMALLGLLYKIDAFNQPGVEQSKKITKQLLKA